GDSLSQSTHGLEASTPSASHLPNRVSIGANRGNASRGPTLHMLGLPRCHRDWRSVAVVSGRLRALFREREATKQPVGGLAGVRGRTHDGPLVLAQDLEPGGDVVGVAYGRNDTEARAHIGCGNLGHEFLAGVAGAAARP